MENFPNPNNAPNSDPQDPFDPGAPKSWEQQKKAAEANIEAAIKAENRRKKDESIHRKTVSLRKPLATGPNGEPIYLNLTGEDTSYFNRYPEQADTITDLMKETFSDYNRPLKLVNIGVSQGQEALGYVQIASNITGEDAIPEALDMELVEYKDKIPLINHDVPDDITLHSYEYLENLYNTPKAHFGTPFQEFIKELKTNNEKRDVILFNNVIQHLQYEGTPEERLTLFSTDMQNMIDVVADNGILCMTCVENALKDDEMHQDAKARFYGAIDLLKKNGFVETSEGIFKKTQQQSEIETM